MVQVCVFEPTPLVAGAGREGGHGLDYWWVQTAQLDLECVVANLAWNQEGTRLLTAGEILQVQTWTAICMVSFHPYLPSTHHRS